MYVCIFIDMYGYVYLSMCVCGQARAALQELKTALLAPGVYTSKYICIYIYMFMYVCMYIYIYVYIHIYLYKYVCLWSGARGAATAQDGAIGLWRIHIYICMFIY